MPYPEETMPLITTADVAPWVQSTAEELDEDPLALKAIDRVSELINERTWGVQPGDEENYWTLDTAPSRAKAIAEQVFARVYNNPKNLASETTGPMSERYADIVLTGLELRPSELEALLELRTDLSGGDRLWTLSLVDTGPEVTPDVVPYVEAYQPRPGEPMGLVLFPSDYPHA